MSLFGVVVGLAIALYLTGVLLMHVYMQHWLAVNEIEEHFFLSKGLDMLILVFWPVFVVISGLVELLADVKE